LIILINQMMSIVIIDKEQTVNLKQLEVFLAVAESSSFSRGAEATYITQSTVSQHISALEIEFGVKLFDRTGKGALLTEGGKILRQHAQQLIADSRHLATAMNQFKGIEHTSLIVGGSTIPGDYMLPEVFPLLLSRFPSLTVTVLQGDSRDILGKLGREEIEVGVVGSWFADEGFLFTPLGSDEIRLVVDRRHRWNRRTEINPEELQEETYVLREAGSGTGKTVKEALSWAGINLAALKVNAYLGSNEAIKHAVAAGLGVSFISEISMRKELERGELAVLGIKGLNISRHFYLVQRAGRELSPAAGAFAGIMAEMYGQATV